MRYTSVLCVVGFLVGCGGGSSGPSGPSPVEECQAYFYGEYCPKVELCIGETHEDCLAQVSTAIDCNETKAIATKFPRCEHDLAALSCDVFSSSGPPASCDGVFLQ